MLPCLGSMFLAIANCAAVNTVVLLSFGIMVFSAYMPRSGTATASGSSDAEAPVLWPCDVKIQLIGKDLGLGKIEGKRRG